MSKNGKRRAIARRARLVAEAKRQAAAEAKRPRRPCMICGKQTTNRVPCAGAVTAVMCTKVHTVAEWRNYWKEAGR